MKAKNFTIFLSIAILFLCKNVSGQANTALSNLVAPTAINKDLLPNPNNTYNLGSGAQGWKNIYIGTSYYLKNIRIIHAPGTTNFFAGPNAGNPATTGTYNTALGDNVLGLMTSGSYNTGIGYAALRNVTTGNRNTALGHVALHNNTTGNYNTASGNAALFFNTSGIYNTAYANSALYKNTTGGYNIAVGNEALYNNTTGSYGIAIGTGALHSATTTGYQLAIGGNALYNLSGGAGGNVAAGYNAMYATTTGYFNTAIGTSSLVDNTTGPYNTAVGHESMTYNTTGRENVSIGAQTMTNNNGSYNTVLGVYAGWNGSTNSVFIGWNAHSPVNTNNSIAIGYNAAVTANNQVRFGNASVTSIGGPVGWSVVSDGRFKKEVKEDVPGLSFINQLRPVTYNFDPSAFNTMIENASTRKTDGNETVMTTEERNAVAEKSKIKYTGFIAQEVDAVAKKMNYDFSGIDAPKNDQDYYGLRYSDFVVPLVKATQELSMQNDSLKKENENLKIQNALFEDRLKKIEALLKINTSPVLSLSSAALRQNNPNPFRSNTTVSYKVPQGTSNAQIIIYDAGGKSLKQFSISPQDNGTVRIDASVLAAGTYHYALFVNGKIIDTKKMVVIK